jgi:hypothetical protein
MGILRKREPAEPDVVVIQSPSRTEYVTRNVNVHEHKAPTDESVKLLREMEAKAEAEVIKAVSVANTHFECVVHQTHDVISDKMLFKAVYKLNGVNMESKVETDPRKAETSHSAMTEAFEKLRDQMVKDLAHQILNRSFIEAMQYRWRA